MRICLPEEREEDEGVLDVKDEARGLANSRQQTRDGEALGFLEV